MSKYFVFFMLLFCGSSTAAENGGKSMPDVVSVGVNKEEAWDDAYIAFGVWSRDDVRCQILVTSFTEPEIYTANWYCEPNSVPDEVIQAIFSKNTVNTFTSPSGAHDFLNAPFDYSGCDFEGIRVNLDQDKRTVEWVVAFAGTFCRDRIKEDRSDVMRNYDNPPPPLDTSYSHGWVIQKGTDGQYEILFVFEGGVTLENKEEGYKVIGAGGPEFKFIYKQACKDQVILCNTDVNDFPITSAAWVFDGEKYIPKRLSVIPSVDDEKNWPSLPRKANETNKHYNIRLADHIAGFMTHYICSTYGVKLHKRTEFVWGVRYEHI